MSASRIRVRQPVSFAGLVLLLAWAGLVWGMVGGSSYRLSMVMRGQLSPLIMQTIWPALGLVLVWLPSGSLHFL